LGIFFVDKRIPSQLFCPETKWMPNNLVCRTRVHDWNENQMLLKAFDDPRLHIAYLLVLGLIHFFAFLGARDFWETENHYAEITRVMLLQGDYWITRFNGSLWADNPPFYFWLTLLFFWATGTVNEWTVRLPSAISATILVLVFYLFSRKWFGGRIAFLATLVLSTSVLTIHVERHIPINSTFFLWLTISMFFFMDAVVSDSARLVHIYGAWFFLGLACLTKAPVSVLLPGLVLFLYLLFSRRGNKAAALRPVFGSLLFLFIISPWFFFVIWKTSGNWIEHFFAQHHVWRTMSHGNPWYYSIVFFPVGFFPWVFLLPPAVMSLWRDFNRTRDTRLFFLFLWWLSVLVLAQLFDGHHNHYLFFALLPASLGLGIFLDKLMYGSENDRVLAWNKGSLIVGCSVIAISGVALPLLAFYQLPEVKWHYAGFGILAVAGAAWIFDALRRRNYGAVVARLVILLLVVDLHIQGFIFPIYNRFQTRPVAEKLGAIVKPGDSVAIYQTELLDNYFNFYSGINHLEHIESQQALSEYLSRPGRRFLLVKQRTVERLQKSMDGTLTSIPVHQPSAKGWFSKSFPRWVLFYSCVTACPPAPPAERFMPPA
jgi:4-amino-4-deoxy-L-arabinose transferase-like glycosyltransferase